jgi:hypothetical protein
LGLDGAQTLDLMGLIRRGYKSFPDEIWSEQKDSFKQSFAGVLKENSERSRGVWQLMLRHLNHKQMEEVRSWIPTRCERYLMGHPLH